jgi:hypothetical protein
MFRSFKWWPTKVVGQLVTVLMEGRSFVKCMKQGKS